MCPWWRMCGVVVAAWLVAGCAIGPAYRRAETAVPPAWKPAESPIIWKPAEPLDTETHGEWWTVFEDERLNTLQRQALSHNQDTKAALARVEQARAAARLTGSDLFPSLESTPSYEHFQRTRSSFGGSGTFGGDLYRVPFDLSYEVDLWGRVRRSFQAARADSQAAEAEYRTALLTLTADVARSYFLLQAIDAEFDTVRRTVALRRDALEVVSKRVEAGVANTLDLARAKTELATAESDAIDLSRRRAEIEHALSVLCGVPASTFGLEPRPLALQAPDVPAGVPSELLERRPDIAAAERQVAAANARIGVALAAFFPVVRLTGSGGSEGSEIDLLFKQDSRFWSLGPSISVPVFTGGRASANLRAARAKHDEAVARYRQQVLIAFREVEDALVNLRLRAEQTRTHQRVLDAARQAAELSHIRYTQGVANYLEFVDAERSRLQAEREAVNILGQRLVSTVLLIKALGGSWESL